MATILIVEDHDNLRDSIKSCLEGEGFKILLAKNLLEAGAIMKELPDLIVLDWMLPDGQGIDFLKQLRKNSVRAPVIFLTARAEVFDKVLALELGASDYMTKPFEPRELVARIRVRLRELSSSHESLAPKQMLLRVGSLLIDREKHKVTFQQRDIDLVKKEYDLLLLFAESPEKVFSRDEILNKVWGYEVFPTTRTVDTHVLFLRQKMADGLIETVRSVGYKFKPM